MSSFEYNHFISQTTVTSTSLKIYLVYSRGLQTTALGPNQARHAISSSRKDILSTMKK